jgi:hypothetical protein
MLEASTSGHAQPKHKTINAEVNLLSEWQRERDSLSEQITRTAIVLTLAAMITFGSAPFLFRAFFGSDRRLHSAQSKHDDGSATLAELDKLKRAATPRLDQGAMRDTVAREAKQFLGHTLSVMNAAEAGMAFESVTADVISGELTINCKADAESNSVVQSFIDDAGKGAHVTSTLLRTAQKNGKLSQDGIGFEYVKKIEVTP